MRLVTLVFLLTTICFGGNPPLSNSDITRMAQAGIGKDAILAAIRGCEPHFGLTPAETDGLMRAGISEEIVRAMAARQNGEAIAQPPAVKKLAEDQKPNVLQRPRPDHWGMTLGMPEGFVGGGVVTTLPDASSPNGLFDVEGGVGLNRAVSMFGSLNYGGFAGTERRYLFGVRLHVPNKTRSTPFVSGLVGYAEQSVSGFRFNGEAVGGAGFGFDVAANRNFGFRTEVRGTRGRYRDWLVGPIFGVFFRYGR